MKMMTKSMCLLNNFEKLCDLADCFSLVYHRYITVEDTCFLLINT